MNKKKNKGFTLIELLITTGFISVSSLGAYAVANVAGDWRKSSQEVKNLNALIQQIDNSTSTVKHYQSITLSSLAFNSALTLADVQPVNKKLNFVYKDVSSRVCNDFASKMLASSKNVGAVINGSNFTKDSLKDIAVACYQNTNDLTIVLNKGLNDFSISTVVASVNPPPPAVPDIEIPTFAPPANWTPPEAFTASTANPTTYPLTSVVAPSFGPVVGGGGPISVTSPPGTTPTVPQVPNWSPPPVWKPPATPWGQDVIDQDPNAPPPPLPPVPQPPPAPTPPPTAVDNSQGGTYIKCRNDSAGAFEIFKFRGYFINNRDEIKVQKYFDLYGGLGTFQSSIYGRQIYDSMLNSLKNKQPLIYQNAYCTANTNQWS